MGVTLYNMNSDQLEKILGREELSGLMIDTPSFLQSVRTNDAGMPIYKRQNLTSLVSKGNGKRYLITGASGSLGRRLCQILSDLKINYLATDIEGDVEYLDVTSFSDCVSIINKYEPHYIINIAGIKYATWSEHQISKTLQVNTIGTQNLINASNSSCKLVLTSTCKSANPETVYGASKLIAERMVVNSGGSVARLFNVVQTQGNVFNIWGGSDSVSPINVVSSCLRHFISIDEACGLILYSLFNKGRFVVNSPVLRQMSEIASALYPKSRLCPINRRRGDRKKELFLSTSETPSDPLLDGSVIQIFNDHDKQNKFIE